MSTCLMLAWHGLVTNIPFSNSEQEKQINQTATTFNMENAVNLPAARSKSLELELTLSMFLPKETSEQSR